MGRERDFRMNEKAFEVRGPRVVAVKLSDVSDQDVIDILEEVLGTQRLYQLHSSADSVTANVSHFEARGADYLVIEGADYALLNGAVFLDRYTPVPTDTIEGDDKSEPVDPGIDPMLRVTALQTSVAISQRGSVTDTDTIIRQAGRIEAYLTKGETPSETPASS